MEPRYVRLDWEHDCGDSRPVSIYYEVLEHGGVAKILSVFEPAKYTLECLPINRVQRGESLVEGDFPTKEEHDIEAANAPPSRGGRVLYFNIDHVTFYGKIREFLPELSR